MKPGLGDVGQPFAAPAGLAVRPAAETIGYSALSGGASNSSVSSAVRSTRLGR